MSEQISKEQQEREQSADQQMMASFAGLTDAEAFGRLFNDVAETMHMMHRQRGHVTDEDLLERSIWRIEHALGYTPPSELSTDDA